MLLSDGLSPPLPVTSSSIIWRTTPPGCCLWLSSWYSYHIRETSSRISEAGGDIPGGPPHGILGDFACASPDLTTCSSQFHTFLPTHSRPQKEGPPVQICSVRRTGNEMRFEAKMPSPFLLNKERYSETSHMLSVLQSSLLLANNWPGHTVLWWALQASLGA